MEEHGARVVPAGGCGAVRDESGVVSAKNLPGIEAPGKGRDVDKAALSSHSLTPCPWMSLGSDHC